MTQTADPTASSQSDQLATSTAAFTAFVAAFAANNQAQAGIITAQNQVISDQSALATAIHVAGDTKAALGHAFADLENDLSALGIELPPPAEVIPPSAPTGDSSSNPAIPDAPTPTPTPTATDPTAPTDATPPTDTTVPPNPVVVDPITGVHVPTDADTGAPLPVPPLPDPTTTSPDPSDTGGAADPTAGDTGATAGAAASA